jgi:hypothetical protein
VCRYVTANDHQDLTTESLVNSEDGEDRVASIAAKQCDRDPAEMPHMDETAQQGTATSPRIQSRALVACHNTTQHIKVHCDQEHAFLLPHRHNRNLAVCPFCLAVAVSVRNAAWLVH